MIKRRFYRFEHGDNDNASSSSSSSDSELEVEASEESESEEEEVEAVAQVKENDQNCSTSSGYESEDSSANEVNVDSAGLIYRDDDESEDDDREIYIKNNLPSKRDAETLELKSIAPTQEDPLPDDFSACVLKCKSVFKCKLCPRIVCLNEETMRAHLKSKRHARSEKLLKEGRLKTMLNSDGEIENQEIAEETDAPVQVVAQVGLSEIQSRVE
ncbi:hypothetical protein COLO4_03615 [Corchorus olitorius]|uniref:C2H2-type domain-containing protein n=1 Tax=Corchorus olitorius TaxID=93759 RepID=A0A1R3KXY6_9ROSI|nr:hypothetical protein COLO4_03615 [Corchorus olitorius]